MAPSGLNTNRIALAHSQITLDYYAGATWTDSAPQLVQTLLIESFENTGRIVAVGRKSVGLKPDYVLKLELRESRPNTRIRTRLRRYMSASSPS